MRKLADTVRVNSNQSTASQGGLSAFFLNSLSVAILEHREGRRKDERSTQTGSPTALHCGTLAEDLSNVSEACWRVIGKRGAIQRTLEELSSSYSS